MVFRSENDCTVVVIGDCNCGCNNEIRITKYKDEPDEYYLSYHSSKWYEEQHGILWTIKTRLIRAFKSLLGKDYLYMDIAFTKQEYDDFVESLKSMQEN